MSLVLKIGDREFPAKRVSTSWEAMKFAKVRKKLARAKTESDKNDLGTELLAIQLRMIEKMLVAEAWEEFEEYMDESELDPGELEEAIGTLMSEVGGEPGKEEPSSRSLMSVPTISENSSSNSLATVTTAAPEGTL